jgi:hypothetical protein
MNISVPVERGHPHSDDASSAGDPQSSPTQLSTSPGFPDTSVSEVGSLGVQDQRDDALSTKAESLSGSKIKKKFSELDIRGAMAGGKRNGVEDFYIQLDEPHRMFYCPGDVVKGIIRLHHSALTI